MTKREKAKKLLSLLKRIDKLARELSKYNYNNTGETKADIGDINSAIGTLKERTSMNLKWDL